MFGSTRSHHTTGTHSRRSFFSPNRNRTERSGTRRSFFHRRDPDRVAGGYQAALHNPNTTREGRKNAKHELRTMGRGNQAHGHPSLKSRLRHLFGIRSKNSRSRSGQSRRY